MAKHCQCQGEVAESEARALLKMTVTLRKSLPSLNFRFLMCQMGVRLYLTEPLSGFKDINNKHTYHIVDAVHMQ